MTTVHNKTFVLVRDIAFFITRMESVHTNTHTQTHTHKFWVQCRKVISSKLRGGSNDFFALTLSFARFFLVSYDFS